MSRFLLCSFASSAYVLGKRFAGFALPDEWNVIISVVCGNYFTGETIRIMWGRETRTWL